MIHHFTRRRSSGLTLVELIVVLGILTILSGIAFHGSTYLIHAFGRETDRNVTQRTVRVWLAQMVRDIQKAGYDPLETGNFGITVMGTQEIRFTTDANQNGILDGGPAENLGYRLRDPDDDGVGVLEKWHGGTGWRQLLERASLQLTYLDTQGNETTQPGAVSIVAITLSATAETGGGPGSEAPVVTEAVKAGVRNG